MKVPDLNKKGVWWKTIVGVPKNFKRAYSLASTDELQARHVLDKGRCDISSQYRRGVLL